MSESILVAVAWPYANAEIHVGNLTGSYLPADIFARYQRLRGNQVLMVSGSDCARHAHHRARGRRKHHSAGRFTSASTPASSTCSSSSG